MSLYQELPDYEEYLTKITLPASTKSKDDSGISDGKGGHISKSDMHQNIIKVMKLEVKLMKTVALVQHLLKVVVLIKKDIAMAGKTLRKEMKIAKQLIFQQMMMIQQHQKQPKQ